MQKLFLNQQFLKHIHLQETLLCCHQQLQLEKAHPNIKLHSTSVSPDEIPGLLPLKKIASQKMKLKCTTQVCGSVVSRAILKLVYQFGIPNTGPQTLKIVKINSSKNRQMTTRAMF